MNDSGCGGDNRELVSYSSIAVSVSSRYDMAASKFPGHSRKIRKPLMEKRRRARINQSLNELKRLILDGSTNKKEAKLEKADILEMTVQHLQKLHKEKETEPMNSLKRNPKFEAGFSECARETQELLSRLDRLDPQVSDRLSNHLASCLDTVREQPTVITLLPTKLPNGDLAFVIPANLKNAVASCIKIPHKEVDLQEDTVWRPW